MLRHALILVLVFSLFACAAENELTRPVATYPGGYTSKPIPVVPKPDPVKTGELPPTLTVGTKYNFRQSNPITKNWVTVIWTVSGKIEWQGKWATTIDMGDRYQILDTNLNFLALADKDGKIISAAMPFIRVYNWPLKTGIAYSTSYDYHSGGKKVLGINDTVTIDEMTSVSVPAGDFSVFVIKRTSVVQTEKIYYAPSVGFPVKWQVSQAVDHPNGPGETVVELVSIGK